MSRGLKIPVKSIRRIRQLAV